MLNSFPSNKECIILKVFFLTLVTFVFVGCTSEKDVALLAHYKEYITYHKQLKHTEKTQLYENNVSKAVLTATYLYTPNFENNDSRDEVFVVGVHLEDEILSTIKGYGYNLTLDGILPKEVKMLSKNDDILKDLSFVTEWGSYYKVTFPHTKAKSFYLVFENDIYGKGTLHFSKVAKYALEEGRFKK